MARTSGGQFFTTTMKDLAYHVLCGSLSSLPSRLSVMCQTSLPNSDFEFIHVPLAFTEGIGYGLSPLLFQFRIGRITGCRAPGIKQYEIYLAVPFIYCPSYQARQLRTRTAWSNNNESMISAQTAHIGCCLSFSGRETKRILRVASIMT